MTTPRSEPMSYADSAWLHMDDPTNLMMVSGVLVFDTPLAPDRLRSVIERRMLRFDRFRQRVVDSSRPLRGLRWEADPGFDLDRHLVREELPAPGDEVALQKRVGELASEPLDPDHPLWRFHLIEQFGGGSALITRVHHCIGDGISMVHALLSLTDTEPGAPPTAEPTDPPQASARELDLERVGRRVGRGLGQAANVTSEFLLRPASAIGVAEKVSSASAALGKLTLMPAEPLTPFKGPLVKPKRVVWSRQIELARVKAIGRKTGSTVNDVLLSAVSGALRRYLLFRGCDVTGLDLRAVVPVNLRASDEAPGLGNRFGLVFLSLPLGIGETLDRVFELKKRMDAIKHSAEAQVSFQIVRLIGMSPRWFHGQVLRIFGKKATAVMTNVKGPTSKIYLGGAPVGQLMFWVPRSAGLGMGVSILSYNDKVCLGLATDAGLVPDPETILAGFDEELDEMLELVRMVESD
jgi:WS/DGAT/MGAT family acyltransferase